MDAARLSQARSPRPRRQHADGSMGNERRISRPVSRETPRTMIRCAVDVANLLDLRTATGRSHAGLTIQDLTCATTDRDGYARCQQVAQVAHQLRLHGVIAPAATGLGETLALFTDVLPEAETPSLLDDEPWHRLPSDPRATPQQTLRLVRSPRID